ncbi:MAG: BolA family protein [Bdellovibrionota bacterium]
MAIQGKIQNKIEDKIHSLKPSFVELINESHNHSVPQNSETHFKLFLVSDLFVGLNRVQRQRKIYDLLTEELKNGVHALTMRLLTPEEYVKEQAAFESPDCHGGSKK